MKEILQTWDTIEQFTAELVADKANPRPARDKIVELMDSDEPRFVGFHFGLTDANGNPVQFPLQLTNDPEYQ